MKLESTTLKSKIFPDYVEFLDKIGHEKDVYLNLHGTIYAAMTRWVNENFSNERINSILDPNPQNRAIVNLFGYNFILFEVTPPVEAQISFSKAF